ncbi:MAG: DUF3016 domain-containing protein [Rubrivivax sp.]|nr:DUF3016 domain-containing protein [Rubrivivax sp.]
MTRSLSQPCLALSAVAMLALAGNAHAVGSADVHFVNPQAYTDAGFGPVENERTQRRLAARLERLAQQLPDGQVLQVQVQDIDLAGETGTLALHEHRRVLGRLPDRPRLTLSFQLLAGDQVLKQGQDVLTADMDYLTRVGTLRPGTPLEFEGRLLDEWFAQRVAPVAGHAP